MIRFEALALAICDYYGGFTPGTKAFQYCNPGLLKTYRPEKKKDGENYRIFTSVRGGFMALMTELHARCTGQNHRLTADNTLQEMLTLYDITQDQGVRRVVLFLRRALDEESVTAQTKVGWFQESGQ